MGRAYKEVSSQVLHTEQTGNKSACLGDDIQTSHAAQFLLKLQSQDTHGV